MIIKLDKLEPETGYFVRVKAINEAGEAPWSEAIHVGTTDEEEETEAKHKQEESEEPEEKPEPATELNTDTGMFYGVFFTGAILIVVVVCVFAMKLV